MYLTKFILYDITSNGFILIKTIVLLISLNNGYIQIYECKIIHIFAPFWTIHLPCPSVPLLIQYSKDVYHYERIMNTDYDYEPAKEIL